MFKKILLISCAFLFISVPAVANEASVQVAEDVAVSEQQQAMARVSFIEGNVGVQRGGLAIDVLSVGDTLDVGDAVLTSEGGYAKVDFADGTSVTLNGEGGHFEIKDYVYDAANPSKNRAQFDILRASFVYVSGALGKDKNPKVDIGLDFGTVGIRGTTFMRAMRDGECWIFLEDGKIKVSNARGSVFLKPGQGTRMKSKIIAPKTPGQWSAENIKWIKTEVSLPGAEIVVPEEKAGPPVPEEILKKIESAPKAEQVPEPLLEDLPPEPQMPQTPTPPLQ